MDNLPSVLQREIWEHVRGDRKFWKQQFDSCLDGVVNPTNIERVFDDDGYGVETLRTFKPHTFPIHQNEDWKFDPVELKEAGYYRIQHPIAFDDMMWTCERRADIFEGFVFHDHVPDYIDMFCGGVWMTRLTPRNNKILIPNFWIPILGLQFALLEFVAVGSKSSFHCSVVMGFLEEWRPTLACHQSRIKFKFRGKKSEFIITPGVMLTTYWHDPTLL